MFKSDIIYLIFNLILRRLSWKTGLPVYGSLFTVYYNTAYYIIRPELDGTRPPDWFPMPGKKWPVTVVFK